MPSDAPPATAAAGDAEPTAAARSARQLRCLQATITTTADDTRAPDAMLAAVARLLEDAWEGCAGACVAHGGLVQSTPGYERSTRMLVARFEAAGSTGEASVAWRDGPPAEPVPERGPPARELLDAVAACIASALERRSLRARLRERESLYSAVVMEAREAIALYDPSSRRFVEFNASACDGLGYTREEFGRLGVADINAEHDEATISANTQQMLLPQGSTFETLHRTRDGALQHVRVSARPVEIEGRPHLAAIWSDITGQKQAEWALRRANRELHAIADANRAIVYARDEDDLAQQVCRSVVESGGYAMAWIGYRGGEPGRRVVPIAFAGPGTDYIAALDVTWDGNDARGRGPSGTALRECRSVVARHIATDPRFAPWRDAALRQGYGSSLAVPLLVEQGRCDGVLSVYAGEPDAFDDAETALLERLAETISFGIRAARDRRARDIARAEAHDAAVRLGQLLAASPVIVYSQRVVNGRATLVDVAGNVTRLLGYTQEEAVAADWWTARVHPEDRARASAAIASALAGPAECIEIEYRLVHRDGHPVRIHDQVRVERDGAGQAVRITGAWTDVTVQREAEAEIRKLSAVVEQSPNSVVITDLAADIEYVNEAFVRNTGYSPAEVIGRNPRILQSGGTPASTYREMWGELTQGRIWRGEFHNRRKDGSRQFERAVIVPLRQDDGRITHYVAVKEDITREKEAEDRARTMRLALEQSPESIVICDLDARIEYVNEAFARHSGYSRDEVLGQNPRVLQSGRTPRHVHDEMWATLTRGEPWKGEFINRRKDGSEFIEFAIIAPVRQPDGRVTHYLAVKEDITDKKRMDEELDRYRHHLEELVESRTAQLAEARERAEAANRAKSVFLANMSHEIRTPMNAIIGLTHLLQSSGATAEQSARLRRIDTAARHLLSIVNDILDLSKVEAGKLSLERVDFDLLQVVDDTFASIALEAESKGLSANLETDAALPRHINGDPLRLGQILINLCGNAVKFTERGSIGLRLRTVSDAPGGPEIRFEVTDTGIGLTEEQKSRMFLPFEQADSSTTRRYGGTGLGLAICRRLVDAMGGRIGVESLPGAGSTFWFTVPFGAATMPAPEVTAVPHAPGPASAPQAREPATVRVLLVEDDPLSQRVALELLRSAGYLVEVAPDGAVAIEMAAGTEYDIILMDLQMPVLNGLEATRRLRATRTWRDKPIVAMTANVFGDDRAACREAGMQDFIPKPVDPDLLLATVARLTSGVAATDSPAGEDAVPPELRERLATLTGLDIGDGLRSVQGRWASYERLLRAFASERSGDAVRLRDRLTAGDVADAQRIAHTLRGVAATLGATTLARAAGSVEAALQGGATAVGELSGPLAAVDRDLRALVTGIEAALPRPHAPAPTLPDDPGARRVVDELDALLSQDDVRALQVCQANEALLRAALGPRAESLARHIAAFEFDRALDLLRATADGSLTP